MQVAPVSYDIKKFTKDAVKKRQGLDRRAERNYGNEIIGQNLLKFIKKGHKYNAIPFYATGFFLGMGKRNPKR